MADNYDEQNLELSDIVIFGGTLDELRECTGIDYDISRINNGPVSYSTYDGPLGATIPESLPVFVQKLRESGHAGIIHADIKVAYAATKTFWSTTLKSYCLLTGVPVQKLKRDDKGENQTKTSPPSATILQFPSPKK